MDRNHFNFLLVWILWIVLLHLCQDVSATGRRCAQGFIEHDNVPRVGEFACCQPTRCGVGKEVIKCTVNGTQDKCQSCSGQYNQSLRTSSYTLERCSHWPLDENCKHIERYDVVTWETKRCMCNIELGYKYEKPDYIYDGLPNDAFCQIIKAKCEPGFEPNLEGQCVRCREHYFKDSSGYTLCEPKKNCTMLGLDVISDNGPERDAECSIPVIPPSVVIAEKPTAPSTTTKPPTAPQLETSTTSVPTTSTTSDSVIASANAAAGEINRSDSIVGPVLGSVAFILIVILIIFAVIFYRRRRRKIFCCGDCGEKCPEPGMDLHISSRREPVKNGCVNGNIHHHLIGGDKTNNNITNPSMYVPSQQPGDTFYPASSTQAQFSPYSMGPAEQRRGILRNVVAAQTRVNRLDSIDSIGQEKALVPLDRSEPNLDLGENDPLLVPHSYRGAAYQNLASSSPCHSPPIHLDGRNPIYSYAQNPSSPPHHFPNGQMSPANNMPTPAYTRSTSVIASPEGEGEEEAVDVLPRFSQLLPDTDQSVTTTPGHPTPTEVTNLIRTLPQRVNQHQPIANTIAQQIQKNVHPKPGLPATHVASTNDNLPDHRIMNLKEQQLAESFHSSEGRSSISLLNETDGCLTRTVRQSPETQQTQVKTETPLVEQDNAKPDPVFTKAVLSENSPNFDDPCVERNQLTCDTDKWPVNENFPLDRRHMHNDQHKPCIKTPEEVNGGARKQRYNRTVSFEADDNAQTMFKHRGNNGAVDIQHRQNQANVAADAVSSSEVQVRGPLRTLSDPEQKNSDIDSEETERKCVSMEYNNSSTGSSKTSVNSELGGSDSNSSSPTRAAPYRRSQSENTHSSTESNHKPPPRSMSEEKPQKADRPVAKVKPMPASDSTLNQLATDVTEGTDGQAQIPATAPNADSSTSPANVLSYSSEDSESEESASEETADQGV